MKKFILFTCILLSSIYMMAQGPVSGPTCAYPGAGNPLSYGCPGIPGGVSRQWCVTGGTIMSPMPQGTCQTTTTTNSVQIVWSTTVTQGTVTVTVSGGGTYSLNVNVGGNFNGGTVSPATQTINYNTIPGAITCPASTGGNCPGGTYSYSWYESPDNINWTLISGATSLNYSPPSALTSVRYYRRRTVSSTFLTDTYSTVATVNVNAQLAGGTITSPVSTSIPYNTAPGQITGTVATGGGCTNNYVYEWYKSTDNVNFTAIASSNSVNYTPPSLTVSTYYKRKVTCNTTQTTYSNTVSIAVSPQNPTPLLPGSISGNTASVLEGSGPGQLTGTAATQGSCGIYSYQWQESPDGVNYYDIAGATSQNFTPTNLSTTSWFRRKVVCTAETGFTNALSIPVHFAPNYGQIMPSSLVIYPGTLAGMLTANPSTGGTCATYTYQWEKSTDNVTYTAISGATAANYTPGSVPVRTWFRRATLCGASVSGYTPSCVISFGPVSTTNITNIRKRDILISGITTETAADNLTNRAEVAQVTQFLDDMNRVYQMVSKQSTPQGKDLVNIKAYDNYGQESSSYLAYPASTSDGWFKGDAFLAQPAHYQTTKSDNLAVSQTKFETTPMFRTAETGTMGVNGQIKSTPALGKTQKTIYRSNLANEVRYWQYNTTNSSATGTTYYLVNELNAMEKIDQDGHKAVEFVNTAGETVCTKSQKIAGDENSYIFTYHVYDALGQLRFIVPPSASAELASVSYTFVYNDAFCKKWLIANKYDQRMRLTEKMLPGGIITYYVYDPADRVILTQDPKLRTSNVWNFVKFDALGREIIGGKYTHGSTVTQAQMQTVVDNYYASSSSIKNYESRSNSDYTNMQGYTNQAFPVMPSPVTTSNRPLIVSYFDDYDFDYNATGGEIAKGEPAYVTMGANFPGAASLAKGMPTGTRKLVLNTTTWLTNATFYDAEGRMIQSQTENYGTTGIVAAGKGRNADVTSIKYDFSGKVVLREYRHCNVIADNTYNMSVKDRRVYDAAARLKEQYVQINSAPEKQVVLNTYNETGELITKKLSPAFNSNAGIETLNFVYDFNTNVTSINKDFLTSSSPTHTNWFGMEFAYDQKKSVISNTSYIAPRYNGSLGGITWKTKGAGVNRKYEFDYDHLNRLNSAVFYQQFSNGWGNADPNNANLNINYSVGGNGTGERYVSYDDNGNISSMWQKGLKLNSSSMIDKLTYDYTATGNKLNSVTDAFSDPNTTLGDFKDGVNSGADYTYDANGNFITDQNKGITAVTYNQLNLPELITFSGNRTIAYVYDASGEKLQKTVTDNSVNPVTTVITKYIGSCIYQNNELQTMESPEGVVRWTTPPAAGGSGGVFTFDYYIRDNLNNVRMVLTEETESLTYPVASMENVVDKLNLSDPNNYIPFFNNVDYTVTPSLRTAISGITDYPSQPAGNSYVSKLNGLGNKFGPSIMLKVMAGDEINLSVTSWYKTTNTPSSGPSPLTDLVAAMAAGIGDVSKFNPALLQSSNVLSPSALSFLNDHANNTGRAKAYINWVLLDEQFQYVASSSGSEQVDASAVFKTHTKPGLAVHRNGYFYIYTSNESTNIDVYFDNLTVSHNKGRLLEEAHYYPMGLEMAGISSKAYRGKTVTNRFKYQGQEFEGAFGLNMNEFQARHYDPQLGRWNTPDPANQFMSPYLGMGNNWQSSIDPDGRLAWFVPIIFAAIANVGLNYQKIDDPFDVLKFAAIGAASAAVGAGIASGISAAMSTAASSTFGAGFAAAFTGSGALASAGISGATSSFFSGALIGASGGLAAGLISGVANGLVNGQGFKSALSDGLRNGAIGGLSAGLIGGVAGGIDAAKDGRRFFDGAKVTRVTRAGSPTNMPHMRQAGDANCGPACASSSSRGAVTQQQVRSWVGGNPNVDPVSIDQMWLTYADKTGATVTFDRLDINSIIERMNAGKDISMNLNVGNASGVGHSVMANRVTERIVQKVSGRCISSMFVEVMNPLQNNYVRMAAHELNNAFKFYTITPP